MLLKKYAKPAGWIATIAFGAVLFTSLHLGLADERAQQQTQQAKLQAAADKHKAECLTLRQAAFVNGQFDEHRVPASCAGVGDLPTPVAVAGRVAVEAVTDGIFWAVSKL